jgi:hypothetical protein
MGKITQAHWEEFVKHKTEPEVLAISNKFVEILKKNIYPHHLGSSGYVDKVGEWKKKLEETVSVGKPNPLEGVEERTQHWLLVRSNLTEEDTLVYKKKEVVVVQQKALEVAAEQRLGLFQSDRENNQLKEALGNPEHIGHIRGVGSQMSWKHGFLKDSTGYKKCDRYKKTLEEKVNKLFENRFMTFIENLSQQQGSPPLHLLAPQAANLSSMDFTTGLGTWYPMDDITVDMPCRLHISLGRVGNKTKEVVTTVAMPRRLFHNNPIPVEYAKILVREITYMGYTDYLLNHVTPEGVKELG